MFGSCRRAEADDDGVVVMVVVVVVVVVVVGASGGDTYGGDGAAACCRATHFSRLSAFTATSRLYPDSGQRGTGEDRAAGGARFDARGESDEGGGAAGAEGGRNPLRRVKIV